MINFELIIDITIIILLLLTINYVWHLSRNLSVLRDDQDSISDLAQSLIKASDKAEKVVAGLKTSVAVSSDLLQKALEEAKNTEDNLKQMTEEANRTITNLKNDIADYASQPKICTPSPIAEQYDNTGKSQSEIELIQALNSMK